MDPTSQSPAGFSAQDLLASSGSPVSVADAVLVLIVDFRYLHPSDEQLREYAPAPKLEKKDKKKQRQQDKSGGNGASNGATFNIPRNIELQVWDRTEV